MVTSLTISPISCRSPSLRVIGSNEVFEAFNFFHNLTCSLGCRHFNWVDVVYGSMPPCSMLVSGSSEGNFYPSCSSSTAFCYSSAKFTVSHAAWDLAVIALFQHFYANCTICSFTSFIFCFAMEFSASTIELAGARHYGGHDSRTTKIMSSVARYGSSRHVFMGSFHALM